MPDGPSPRDPTWYQDRWEELMALLAVSEPEDVLDRLRTFQAAQDQVDADSPGDLLDSIDRLQERAETLDRQQAVLKDAGFRRPETALQAIESMEAQLDELYNEKEVTERSDAEAALQDTADTFDQLQALLAREEKLQRELGVSNPDAVVEMVEGLSDQLEDVYEDRDAEKSNSIFAPASGGDGSAAPSDPLMDTFGISDPDDAVQMLNDLTDQLNDLYAERERLAELNLTGADDAIAMVRSMQQQLESLYERQEELSAYGVDSIDHALSMIENLEAQLSALYDTQPDPPQATDDLSLDEATARLDTLEQKLTVLTDEKKRLREKRDRLQKQIDDLEETLGTGDPEVLSGLFDSMEAQLADIYEEREAAARRSSPDPFPLLDDNTLAGLDTMDAEALHELPVGLFCLDEQGTVQRANDAALRWPDLTAEAPDAVQGASFFESIAPGTNNALFRGRFEDGLIDGVLDEQFLYTYVGKDTPLTNLAVHLYSAPDQSAVWIVFEILDRY